ncbi:MAG: hypothetical protein Q7R44_00280 [bacterium]|nr:hypothetical protein [bacterium]
MAERNTGSFIDQVKASALLATEAWLESHITRASQPKKPSKLPYFLGAGLTLSTLGATATLLDIPKGSNAIVRQATGVEFPKLKQTEKQITFTLAPNGGTLSAENSFWFNRTKIPMEVSMEAVKEIMINPRWEIGFPSSTVEVVAGVFIDKTAPTPALEDAERQNLMEYHIHPIIRAARGKQYTERPNIYSLDLRYYIKKGLSLGISEKDLPEFLSEEVSLVWGDSMHDIYNTKVTKRKNLLTNEAKLALKNLKPIRIVSIPPEIIEEAKNSIPVTSEMRVSVGEAQMYLGEYGSILLDNVILQNDTPGVNFIVFPDILKATQGMLHQREIDNNTDTILYVFMPTEATGEELEKLAREYEQNSLHTLQVKRKIEHIKINKVVAIPVYRAIQEAYTNPQSASGVLFSMSLLEYYVKGTNPNIDIRTRSGVLEAGPIRGTEINQETIDKALSRVKVK